MIIKVLNFITISIDNNKTIFLPGQRIEGNISISFTCPTLVKLLRVKLTGHIFTHVNKNDPSIANRISSILLFKDFSNLNYTTGHEPIEFPDGESVFPFLFRLPSTALPPSFEGFYGRITYEISCVLLLANQLKKVVQIPITVPSTLCIQDPSPFSTSISIPTKYWCFKTGHVDVMANISKNVFYSEDSIQLLIEITNQSNQPITLRQFSIKQKCTYKLASDTRGPKTERIHKLSYSETFASHVRKITRNILITIPSTDIISSSIVTPLVFVSHFVCFQIMAGRQIGKISIPFTICGFPCQGFDLDGNASITTLPRYIPTGDVEESCHEVLNIDQTPMVLPIDNSTDLISNSTDNMTAVDSFDDICSSSHGYHQEAQDYRIQVHDESFLKPKDSASLLLTPFVLHSQPISSRELYSSVSSSYSLVPVDKSIDNNVQQELLDVELKCSGSANDINIGRYVEILGCIEDLILDHILHDHNGLVGLSRLTTLVPSIGKFFTPLPLKSTFLKINKKLSISARRFVPPSFNDVRHLLNSSQVIAISKILKLVTFDGDCTLYADGKDFSRDSQLVGLLIGLLSKNIRVAIVTAAGYPKNPTRYEQRLSGLLQEFQSCELSHEHLSNFYVLGGECNYLFKYDPVLKHLVYIEPFEYQSSQVRIWHNATESISQFLDIAESNLRDCANELGLKDQVDIIRKQLSIGVTPLNGRKFSREQLDEFALSTQRKLQNYLYVNRIKQSESEGFIELPFCAFNGGSDVWVDIGNKLIGVQILQEYFKTQGHETLHVGDQFLSTGNDIATRAACCTAWITSPKETEDVLQELMALL